MPPVEIASRIDRASHVFPNPLQPDIKIMDASLSQGRRRFLLTGSSRALY